MVGSEKLPGLNPLSKGVLPRWKPLHRIITPLAVMLAFVFAVPIEAVDRCDYGKTNYYIETRCIKYHNPYCASDQTCEILYCNTGTCFGQLDDCVGTQYACLFHGCLQCPNCP